MPPTQPPPHFPEASLAKWLIVMGVIFVVSGLVLLNKDKWPFFRALGHLPGDISIHRENIHVYIPLTTSLVLSLVITLVFWLLRR